MTKFITPVSMQVTEEQYKTDLRDKLLAMGYYEYSIGDFQHYGFICTSQCGTITNLRAGEAKSFKRHFIPTYNPELFLALAGMTDDKEIKLGDWILNKETGYIGINQNEELFRFTYIYRKATKEEIIQHFEPKKAACEQLAKAFEETNKLLRDLEKTEPIFRVADTVYHWKHGKGEVKRLSDNFIYVEFKTCDFGSAWLCVYESELSFTPYNLKDGGFSQERPEPKKKSKDDAVSVGYGKAYNHHWNVRNVFKDSIQDVYYSGWMDCFDWITSK